MIIEDIINKLLDMNHEYCMENYDSLKNPPEFVIYIGIDLFHDLKREISDRVPHYMTDWVENDEIYGFPVYTVANGNHNFWEIYRKEN